MTAISDPLATAIAERLRVIGDPMRIKLLDQLRAGEASVGELTAAVGTGQQNVSRHLNLLHAAGIARRRRQGTRVLYSIGDESVFALCDTVCGSLRALSAERASVLAVQPPLAKGAAR